MLNTDPTHFNDWFSALTGYSPFAWQLAIFQSFCGGNIPPLLNLPTGLGKTSVISIWLMALGHLARTNTPNALPRRIVWVVDRRVVVDQASEEAARLALNLANPSPPLAPLALALRSLSIAKDGPPVAVSTLRGELADNREWSRDPSRPAIIVGTVDMVGSRLLFSGYGDSRRRRALHASLLGQDALIVNDESHLTPAFANLLTSLSEFTSSDRPLRTMLLSATPRESGHPSFPATLDADLSNGVFEKRYRAVKRLRLIESVDPKQAIHNLALQPDRRTLVFVRSPKDARKIAAAIEAKHHPTRVPLITGVQRGWERDRLLQLPTVKRFLSKETPSPEDEPCWLVATSAGEVGIDLSSDRLITDLDTADHLLQRFGRLNRFGETQGDAYLVYSPNKLSEVDPAKAVPTHKEPANAIPGDSSRFKATVEYLNALPDLAPETLRTRPPPASALSATPHFAPLLPWHVDVWSMTSLSSSDWPSRPAVEFWLRGDDEKGSPPETYVAWRDDVGDLVQEGVTSRDREEVVDCYPVIAQERLKCYTGELYEELSAPEYASTLALVIAADGEVHSGPLGVLLQDRRLLRYATLLLPPGVGHLDRNGMVDWKKPIASPSADVISHYDKSEIPTRKRVRVVPGELPPATDLRWRYTVRLPADADGDEPARLIYFAGVRSTKSVAHTELLTDHHGNVANVAASLVRCLGFDESTARVFEWVAHWHDAGKSRDVWQRAAGNWESGGHVAKCPRLDIRLLDGFRHELASLLDAAPHIPDGFTPIHRDLALHLIASHHGWARPHFTERALDKENVLLSRAAALECARRFGHLQRHYGAWKLAYLESIFRSADAIASANTPELPANA